MKVELIKRGASRIYVTLDGRRDYFHGAVARVVMHYLDKGWTMQQAYDRMRRSVDRVPRGGRYWATVERMGRMLATRSILSDEALGPLTVRRARDGRHYAFRQKKGQCSTSFVDITPRTALMLEALGHRIQAL